MAVVCGPLTYLVAALAVMLLASWVPHYLTWPWWPDLDAYATIAQGWDAGIAPYHDVVIFNFPGQIYLFWLLGKTLGWGGTTAIYAVDAGLLVGFGAAVVAWSRRRLGRTLPGWIGFVAFLAYYLNLDYSGVAQRDWQGPLFVVLGLMAIQALPGRRGRVLSALGFALGATFRPHVVLFLPALALAIETETRAPGESWRSTLRAWLFWSLTCAGFLLIGLRPVDRPRVIRRPAPRRPHRPTRGQLRPDDPGAKRSGSWPRSLPMGVF